MCKFPLRENDRKLHIQRKAPASKRHPIPVFLTTRAFILMPGKEFCCPHGNAKTFRVSHARRVCSGTQRATHGDHQALMMLEKRKARQIERARTSAIIVPPVILFSGLRENWLLSPSLSKGRRQFRPSPAWLTPLPSLSYPSR